MSSTAQNTARRPSWVTGIFDRIVCGVDGSEPGREALAQAARLLSPGGELVAVTAYDPSVAAQTGWAAPEVARALQRQAREVAGAAAAELTDVPGARAVCVQGDPRRCLLGEAARRRAALLVIGTQGGSRTAGILLGSVTTALLHEAPCPVCVARRPADPARFPRRLLVGVDGSRESLAAEAAARELAGRFGAAVRVVAATGGKPVEVDGLARLAGLEWDERAPLDALVAASADSDLLLLGSRGLHGIASLGSVSERVAHRASCSVLVVRPTSVR